ncbi:Cytochrome P450 [Trinorchestia longiramus]|nr:Cytochrome P450 [Trinorchestia longiramus]
MLTDFSGRRYDLDAAEVCQIFSLIEGVKKASALTVLLGIFPVLNWLPSCVQSRLFRQQHLHSFLDHMRALSQRTIDDHLSSIDYDNPRDLTDRFLKQMKEQTEEDPEKRFRIEGLHQLLFDLFNTGSDTVSNMLHWIVYYMAKYPDMALRCQEQIDSVVDSKEVLVSLEHRKHLPYVEAFTTEALRHSSMVVFMPHRCCTRDTSIRNYLLPKGTMITTCNYMVHRDPKYWNDPDQFLPERFLDADGNFVAQKDAFLPFGIGRRQCAGEALARTEYFLFSAAILQNFLVAAAPGCTLIEEPHEYLGFRIPAKQLLVYKER